VKSTVDDPNLLQYKFHCDWGITAYTLVVNRTANDDGTLDDFSSTASVFDTSGNAVTTQSFSCAGQIPGRGVNCNAGGGYMAAPNYAEGTINATEPYCPNVTAGSRAGAKPEPGAVVQLVVTDSTGAQDGPFRLRLRGKCPAVHVTTPKRKPKKATHR
jgi:hypothetical protein